MNRTATRAFLGLSALASVGGFTYAANPRITAWNQVSSSSTIATTRAASCTVVARPLALGMRVMAEQGSNIPLPAGSFVCDRRGGTGQISITGHVQYIKTAPSEILNQILDKRGTPTAPPALPSASPHPPTNPQ
jgi:hypothetical protein